MTVQKDFIDNVISKVKSDANVIGLAVAGSFITSETDQYSDVDLVLVTREPVAPNRDAMVAYAQQLGDLLNNFTGEHVGEPRLLICLYQNPLLHVDIKFLLLDEFRDRVEDPVVVWEQRGYLSDIIANTKAQWPAIDYQWIEDRFWTWVHYISAKIGRGEGFEALESLSFIRTTVTAPLLQVRNGRLPRGLRKVEFNFADEDMQKLISTVPEYSLVSIITALNRTIKLYQELRLEVYPATVVLREEVRMEVLRYLENIIRSLEL